MKDCSFAIRVNDESGFTERAREVFSGAGGALDGDSRGGTFRLPTGIGKIEGNYRVGESTLYVTLTAKPALISCGRVEKEIRKYLENE